MIVEVIERRLQRRGDIDLKESLPNRVSFLDEADVHRVDPLLGCLEGWTEDGHPHRVGLSSRLASRMLSSGRSCAARSGRQTLR